MNKNAPATHKVRKSIVGVIMNVILLIFSISCIFPIVWMAYSSLKEKRVFNADIIGLPKNPTLINYIKILTNKDYHLEFTVPFLNLTKSFITLLDELELSPKLANRKGYNIIYL